MQVLKFGGSSVADASRIKRVAEILRSHQGLVIVVVSAMGGVTDQLVAAAEKAAAGDESWRDILVAIEGRHLEAVRQLIPVARQSSVLSAVKKLCNALQDCCNGIALLREVSPRARDRVLGFGELLSSRILSATLSASGMENTWVDSRELIVTGEDGAVHFEETNRRIPECISRLETRLVVAPGFIAATAGGAPTTLGRGGSDYSAAIFAAALNAGLLEIWTDVDGLMTADPSQVSAARVIPHISYQEALELSHFGAKVIYPPTIVPVLRRQIPVRVRNSFNPSAQGTLIDRHARQNGGIIRGISSVGPIAILRLEGSGMVGVPGFSRRLFQALAEGGINVILITQGSSEHAICVAVEEKNAVPARGRVDQAFATEIAAGVLDPLHVETGLSIVAVVGDHMRNHPGISGRMFGAFGRNGINVRAIAQGASERNISAVISGSDVRKALNVLHEEFFETTSRQVHLYLAGTGNVGSRLLEQLALQRDYLQKALRLQIRIVGLANSRCMTWDAEGIDPARWKEALEKGEPLDTDKFFRQIRRRNLRNSIFVDVTASADLATRYADLLAASVAVVACNKVACSSELEYYHRLKSLAAEFNAPFLFETNVGAGLPVIGTLNDLLRSGDRIHRIQAVLSGTLNFVFNEYRAEKSFAEVVRQAQAEGYTEPDPRLDLGGTDVMRKIMILAREAGAALEMPDIVNHSFMPPECMEGDIEHFYASMERHEAHFRKLYLEAADSGRKLKYVASWEPGKARVGLEAVDPAHDFYHLYGKDNVVLFYTERYRDQPLVIKGAGAGAEVTASGVFGDIIRAAKI